MKLYEQYLLEMQRELRSIGSLIYRIDNNEIKILVIRRASWDKNAGTWEPVKGGANENEKLEDAVIRETKEEVGLDVIPIQMISTWRFEKWNELETQKLPVTFYCYISKLKHPDQHVKLSHEHSTYVWLKKSHALSIIHYEKMREATKKGFEIIEKNPEMIQ